MFPFVRRYSSRYIVAILAATLLPSILSAQSTPRGPSTALAHSIYGTPDPAPVAPMPLVAPVFLQTDQIDSSITVVNSITLAVNGTVTLRNQAGEVIGQQIISFPAHSSTPVALKTLLAAAGSQAHSGSVTLLQDAAFKGPALLAQLSMALHTGSQSAFLEEEFGMPTPHGSAVLRGVASQTRNLPLVAITSISEAPQTITASCVGESASPSTIEVPAYGTAVVQACSWQAVTDGSLNLASSLLNANGSIELDHAISLKTDSVPGAFYAFGFALNGDLNQAQLQPLDFYDPGTLASSSTVYVGVPVGASPLLPAVLSAPVLTLANYSNQPRQTTVTFSDSSSGSPKVHTIANFIVPPFSTQTDTLAQVVGSGLLNTFTIASDGQPGDIQAHLFTRVGSSAQRAELLAKDARDDHNGGNHPWSTANGDISTLLLYNSTAQPKQFQVRISGSGSSWLQLFRLAAFETRAVLINDVIAKRTPDYKGKTLPVSLTAGEVQWSTDFGATGLGRIVITNANTALLRNFSCATYYNLCGATFGSDNYEDMLLDGQATNYESINPVFCTVYSPTSCSQATTSGQTESFTTYWQNPDTNIVQTVYSNNSYITLQGVGSGTFGISAYAEAGSCATSPMSGGGTVMSCTDPTGDSAQAYGANPTQNYTYTEEFIMTLSVPGNVSLNGENLQEQSGSPGQDACYFSGSTYTPQTTITSPYTWTIGTPAPGTVTSLQTNQWGADAVGPSDQITKYYQYNERSHGGSLPCGISVNQSLQIYCGGQPYIYANNTLSYSINIGGVYDCRNSTCSTILNH